MTRGTWLLIAVVLALGVAGQFVVSSGGGEPARGVTDSGDLQAQWIDLPDGRVVICVKSDPNSFATGIDCDWATAALEGEAP